MPTKRPQARIVRIGTVRFCIQDCTTEVRDWVFQTSDNSIPECDWTEDGKMLLFGYTAAELAEIVRRRKEWE